MSEYKPIDEQPRKVRQVENLAGRRFGRITVRGRGPNEHKTMARWHCVCDCGKQTLVRHRSLVKGLTMSCGCYGKEIGRTAALVHGESHDPTRVAWIDMLDRCQNPSNASYHNYGGRGISVCQWWTKSFDSFLRDVGRRPSKNHSIDRINNNGNYEPGNCRWATRTEQSRNRRTNRLVTAFGETLPAISWAERYGLRPTTLINRLNSGMSPEDAIRKPANQRKATSR